MKSNGMFSNLRGGAIFATICAAVLASSIANAETWYWVGNNMNASSQRLWNGGLNNWTNATGEAGDPARGDNVVLNDNTRSAPYMVCNSNAGDTSSTSPRVALNSIVFDGFKKSCSQGNFALIGGGDGLTVLGSSYSVSHYCGILLEGEGDVPFNIVEASSEFRGQMRVVARKDPDGKNNPVLVKKGPGTLVCFYQSGSSRAYELPLAKIQQGTIDVTPGRAMTNVVFRFDGNDPSARLAWGYYGSVPLLMGLGCAITESDDVANTGHGISCKYNQQIQFYGTPAVSSMTFSGTLYGGAGLLWHPDSADYVFNFSSAVSATTGGVSVVNGTVKFSNGASMTSLSSLSVGATGALEVEQGSGASFHAETVDLVSGCKLKLGEGVVLRFGAATLDTLPLVAGTYAATAGEGVKAATWIEGDGTVVVETGDFSSVTWVGSGQDTGVATEGNWSPATPDLADGGSVAVFADGGSEANIDRNVSFAGLSLKGGFSFAGNGTMALGSMGIATLDAASDVGYSFASPIEVAEGQSWTIGANNTFNVNGGLSGSGALAVSGEGVLNLGGENTLVGPVDVGTRTTISGLNALGAAGTVSRVRNDSGSLCFSSATNAAAVWLYSVGAFSEGNAVSFVGDNVFNGPVTNEMGTLALVDGATVEFAQRFRGNSIKFGGTGNLIFRDRFVLSGSAGTFYMNLAGSDVTVDFYADNNGVSGTFWSQLSRGTIRCHVPYALKATGYTNGQGNRMQIVSPATIDLCGNDQSLDGIIAKGGGYVTSEESALFHHVSKNLYNTSNDADGGNVNRTNNLVFVGMAGFSHDGPMTNRLGAVSTTAGTLQVTDGKLIMLPQASWANCTNVVVTGGTLALENTAQFSANAVVSISGEGSIDLDFDGRVRCDNLFIDGVKKPGGVYSAANDAHFHGTGELVVKPRGLVIMFR